MTAPRDLKALAPIREVDSEDQLSTVLAMPDHIRDALWKIEMAQLQPMPAPAAAVCGMGGSAIGGDLAAAALGARLRRPLVDVRSYELPAWLPEGAAVLCSSYSGNTEETLAAFEAAGEAGCERLVATTGGKLADAAREAGVPVVGLPAGLQPRAAVGYMLVVSAEIAALSEAAEPIRDELRAAADHLEKRIPALAERSAELADELEGTAMVVHGADLTGPVAFRWKCQVNENAKIPAFSSVLPESNHNELVGWEGAPEVGAFSVVVLDDPDQHERVRLRNRLTGELAGPGAKAVVTLSGEGRTRPERMLDLIMLGDLLSLQLAARRGVEPSSVAVIDRLKSELGKA